MAKKFSPLLVFLALLLVSLLGLSYESVISINISGRTFINFDLWSEKQGGQDLSSSALNPIKSEPQKDPNKNFHPLNEVQPVSISVDKKETKSQNETASTSAGYFNSKKSSMLKFENNSDTLRTLVQSEHDMKGGNTSNEELQFQDARQTSVGDIIASTRLASSSFSSASHSPSPSQSSSPSYPPTSSPSSTPPPACSSLPSKLQGRFSPLLQDVALSEVEDELGWLTPGGEWSPRSCITNDHVALVIPYRNRLSQLTVFLRNLHPMLRRQELHYRIYLVNQTDPNPFNRAMLFNVGFMEAMKDHNWTCVIFHDVDLIPEDDRNVYRCAADPRHMSVAVDKFGYKLPYATIFGGATALTPEQFRQLNGFSNMFWGWGGEDDDMAARVKSHGMRIERYSEEIARYRMIKHKPEKPNKMRWSLLKSSQRRLKTDGLVSLEYKVVERRAEALFTEVDVALTRTNGDVRGHPHFFHSKLGRT